MNLIAGDALHVLVADAHRDSAVLTARILTFEGYAVWTAATRDEALAVARAVRIDVLVSEVGLPGCHACDLLRELTAVRPLRAMIFSGYPAAADRARLAAAGFTSFLTKGPDVERLPDVLRAVVLNELGVRHGGRN